jgi:hypothetical protein
MLECWSRGGKIRVVRSNRSVLPYEAYVVVQTLSYPTLAQAMATVVSGEADRTEAEARKLVEAVG